MSLTLAELITDRLNTRMHWLQAVQARHGSDHISSTQVRFPYGNWLTDPAPVFYRNGTIFTPDSYDADAGTATISDLTAHDDIRVNYTFKYFSTTELQNFYKLALSRANNTAPATSFLFTDYPADWEDYLTAYAYRLCLQTILVDLMNWRGALIWKDPTGMAGVVQTVMAQIDADLAAVAKTLKGRRFLTPRSVSAGRYSTPAQVSDWNWQRYAVVNTTG